MQLLGCRQIPNCQDCPTISADRHRTVCCDKKNLFVVRSVEFGLGRQLFKNLLIAIWLEKNSEAHRCEEASKRIG